MSYIEENLILIFEDLNLFQSDELQLIPLLKLFTLVRRCCNVVNNVHYLLHHLHSLEFYCLK